MSANAAVPHVICIIIISIICISIEAAAAAFLHLSSSWRHRRVHATIFPLQWGLSSPQLGEDAISWPEREPGSYRPYRLRTAGCGGCGSLRLVRRNSHRVPLRRMSNCVLQLLSAWRHLCQASPLVIMHCFILWRQHIGLIGLLTVMLSLDHSSVTLRFNHECIIKTEIKQHANAHIIFIAQKSLYLAKTSVQNNLAKGRIADLSPLAAANAFITSWPA